MSDHLIADGTFINSIVGEGTRFSGDLNLSGLLRIDGDYSGTITTSGKVLVGKNGRAECTITAATIVIGGVVKGNIISSEKVIVLSTGMVIGNVTTPRLIVENGVILNGLCKISEQKDTEKPETIVERHTKEEYSTVSRDGNNHNKSKEMPFSEENRERKEELSAWKG